MNHRTKISGRGFQVENLRRKFQDNNFSTKISVHSTDFKSKISERSFDVEDSEDEAWKEEGMSPEKLLIKIFPEEYEYTGYANDNPGE